MPDLRTPHQKADYQLAHVDGENLLAHPATTTTLYLNETASLVWQLCDGQRTNAEIAVLLADAFPQAGATIPEDVDATLERLREHGAIEFVEPRARSTK